MRYYLGNKHLATLPYIFHRVKLNYWNFQIPRHFNGELNRDPEL